MIIALAIPHIYAMSQVPKMTDIINSSLSSHIYLDHNATTPVSALVASRLPEALQAWGNPSSIHAAGRKPKALLREARQIAAQALKCNSLEIIFTSGGSESNTTVLKSFFEILEKARKQNAQGLSLREEFITSAVEHPSVMKTLMSFREAGYTVHIVPVNREGVLDIEFYQKVLTERTALVSIMLANNETGTIFPVQKLAQMAHAVGAKFHTDAVQALGKIPVDLTQLGVDYASFSAHKFYAIKGAGLLYQKRGAPLVSLILGGGQERHRRGGTENVLGIHGLRVVLETIGLVIEKAKLMAQLRDQLEVDILKQIPEVRITAASSERLPNTSSLVIRGVDGETLLMSLDLRGFSVSTGAACSSGNPEPSPVLLAMGLSRAEAQNSLRVSIGWSTTTEQLKTFVSELVFTVKRLRSFENQSVENSETDSGVNEGADASKH